MGAFSKVGSRFELARALAKKSSSLDYGPQT